ncbi:MAG TPA: GxxExxY protein [Xanthomonadaceae bacterium]|nr:GxxExxY protein [Xanthomonadaceae bacterium]
MNRLLSERVIGCALTVSGALGHGFLERVYEEALSVELRASGIVHERQKAVTVQYRGRPVGEYCCDLIVEDRLLVEVKAVSALSASHDAQLMNYLKATGLTAGLLLNFGTPKLGIRRIVTGHDDTDPI